MGTSLAVANQVRFAVGLTSPHTADLDFNGYRIMMGPSLGNVLKPQNLAAFSLINKAPTAMALSGLRPGARLVDLLHALWTDSWYNPDCFENIAIAYIERTAIRHREPHMFIKGNPSTLPPPRDTLVLITKQNAYARLELGATLQQYMAEDQFSKLNRLTPAPLPEFTKLLALHGKLPKDDGSPNRTRPSRPDPKRRNNTPLRRVAADLTQKRAALTAQHHSMRHLIPADRLDAPEEEILGDIHDAIGDDSEDNNGTITWGEDAPADLEQYNIVCQYGGKRIPLYTAEHPNYPSDYLWGWPEYDEAIDGQLDTTGSIGPLINDDFTRTDSSLEAWRDEKTGRTFLCQIEDIYAGEELSLSYGKDFWLGHFLQLSAEARKQCIWKYSISPAELALFGLLSTGMATEPIHHNITRPEVLDPRHKTITIPATLLCRPWAVEVGNLRLWLHTGRRQGDLLINRNTAIDDLCTSLRRTAIRLGYAIRIPNLPSQICRPDGSCGAQMAVIFKNAGATPLLPLSNTWYFQTEDRHQRYISQLQEWSCNTSTPGRTKKSHCGSNLAHTRNGETGLPRRSGEENSTTWDCLTTYLSTDRSNSILAHSHFHPWSTSEELAATLWEALPLLAAKILAELNNPPSVPADENGTVFLEISSNRTVPITQSPRWTSHPSIISDQSAPLPYWSLAPTMPHANIKKKNQKKKKTHEVREQQTLDSCWKVDSLLNAPTTQSAVNTDTATRLSCNIGPPSSPVIWMDLTMPTTDPDLTLSTPPSLALLATFAPDLLLDDFPPILLNPLAPPFLPHAHAHPTLVAQLPTKRALTLRPSSHGPSTLINPSTPLHPTTQPNVDPLHLIPTASLRATPTHRWGSSIKRTSWHRKAPTPIGFTPDRDGAEPPHLYSPGTDWPLPLLTLPREELVCALRQASLQSGLHGQN
eukprot:gene410-432_t